MYKIKVKKQNADKTEEN